MYVQLFFRIHFRDGLKFLSCDVFACNLSVMVLKYNQTYVRTNELMLKKLYFYAIIKLRVYNKQF